MKVRDYASLLKSTLAAVLVLAGFIGLARLDYRVTPDVAFICVVSIFAFTFALTSSRLRQVTGPGGFSAEFQEVAAATVESGAISPVGSADGDDFIMVSKRGLQELEQITQRLSDGDYVALRLRVGARDRRYDPYQVGEYVRSLAAITRHSWIILIDANDRFVGAAEAATFLRLSEASMREFLMVVQEGNMERIRRLPTLKYISAPVGIDNREALRLMSHERVDFLVLVDANQVPRRIATRARIAERLLLALAR